jgi:hypothetical protein
MTGSLLFRQFMLACLSLLMLLVGMFTDIPWPHWALESIGFGFGFNLCLFCLMAGEVKPCA